MISLDHIESVLAGYAPAVLPSPSAVRNRASVAMIFAGAPDALSLCFIRRTTRKGDPWSGHMAFPGGRADLDDATPQAAAEREVAEEVGLDLGSARALGALDEVSMRRVVQTDSVLSPFAYYWGPAEPTLVPEQSEVAAGFWIPLRHLWDPANRTMIPWAHEGRTLRFPGIAHGDDVIWGLTHRVLGGFAELLGRPLPP